ncbi:MAG: cyclic nucleotide-binding domain-containing protein [Acidobacteriota bacterium]
MNATEITTHPPRTAPPPARFSGVNPLLLASASRLSEMDSEDLTRLAGATECQLVANGSTLFQQGDCADAVYFILDGAVKLEHREPDGRVESHEVVGPYASFGDVVLVVEPMRYYTAITRSETVLLRMPLAQLKAALSTHPDINSAWIHAVSSQMQHQHTGLADALLQRISNGVSSLFDAA